MFCSRCGAPIQPGQLHCSCGQFTGGASATAAQPTNPSVPQGQPPAPPPGQSDLPEAFYQRLQSQVTEQVTESGRDNFKKGLALGLAFLLAFLLLETAMDALTFARSTAIGLGILTVAALIIINGIYLGKRWFAKKE